MMSSQIFSACEAASRAVFIPQVDAPNAETRLQNNTVFKHICSVYYSITILCSGQYPVFLMHFMF